MKLFSLLATLILLSPLTARSQDTDALRNISGMRVLIESLHSDAEVGNLNKIQLTADVELRLRKAGLRVIKDSAESSNSPFLYVNVNAIKSSIDDTRAYNVSVEFIRAVTIDSRSTPATVWGKSYLGIVGSNSGFALKARESVAALVDLFINDFLAANPKAASIRIPGDAVLVAPLGVKSEMLHLLGRQSLRQL